MVWFETSYAVFCSGNRRKCANAMPVPSLCDERWIAASEGDQSGCTLIVALIVDDLVVVANAGECSRNVLSIGPGRACHETTVRWTSAWRMANPF